MNLIWVEHRIWHLIASRNNRLLLVPIRIRQSISFYICLQTWRCFDYVLFLDIVKSISRAIDISSSAEEFLLAEQAIYLTIGSHDYRHYL